MGALSIISFRIMDRACAIYNPREIIDGASSIISFRIMDRACPINSPQEIIDKHPIHNLVQCIILGTQIIDHSTILPSSSIILVQI